MDGTGGPEAVEDGKKHFAADGDALEGGLVGMTTTTEAERKRAAAYKEKCLAAHEREKRAHQTLKLTARTQADVMSGAVEAA